MESFVYRSRDGTHWTRLPLPESVQLSYASVAYGGGHYVITGEAVGGNVVFDSVDGETWREQILDDPKLGYPGRVSYVRDRFFAMGYSLWSSLDGENWTRLAAPYMFAEAAPTEADLPPGFELAQGGPPVSPFIDIAFGGGQYIGVGLATLLSPDGADWQFAPIKCPSGCGVRPDDTILEQNHISVFFAEGRYYVDQLSSADGHIWDVLPTPHPTCYAAGHLMTSSNSQLAVWLAGNEAPRPIESLLRKDKLPAGVSEADANRWSVPSEATTLDAGFPQEQTPPDSLDFSWSDGLDCTSARCLIVTAQPYSRLYLVP